MEVVWVFLTGILNAVADTEQPSVNNECISYPRDIHDCVCSAVLGIVKCSFYWMIHPRFSLDKPCCFPFSFKSFLKIFSILSCSWSQKIRLKKSFWDSWL